MLMASKGHFLGQMPQPMQRRSEMKAILLVGSTSMQSLPVRTTGQDFLHSWRHFLGLHLNDHWVNATERWLTASKTYVLVAVDNGDTSQLVFGHVCDGWLRRVVEVR